MIRTGRIGKIGSLQKADSGIANRFEGRFFFWMSKMYRFLAYLAYSAWNRVIVILMKLKNVFKTQNRQDRKDWQRVHSVYSILMIMKIEEKKSKLKTGRMGKIGSASIEYIQGLSISSKVDVFSGNTRSHFFLLFRLFCRESGHSSDTYIQEDVFSKSK